MQVAHLQPPSPSEIWRASSPQSIGASSAAGHGTEPARQPVACEALYNLKWLIENTGVRNPVYKLSLQSAEDQPPTPLFQISKPNQHAKHWTMFYFAYAGYDISPRRIQVRLLTSLGLSSLRFVVVWKDRKESALQAE